METAKHQLTEGVHELLNALGRQSKKFDEKNVIPILSGFAAGFCVGAGVATLLVRRAGAVVRKALHKPLSEASQRRTRHTAQVHTH